MKQDVICIGQAVVDCIVRDKENAPEKTALRAESISLSIGGDAVNEAIALRQKGINAAAMIAVGEDAAGTLLLQTLQAHQVSTDLVTKMPAPFMTPVANLIVSADGSRTSVNAPAAMLPGYRPDAGSVQGAKIISLASLFRAPLDDTETLLSIAKAAKENGAILCADTKLPTFRALSLTELREVLPLIDYIFPNEKEAAHYTGKDDFEAMADVFLSHGVGHVVIKAGPQGCFAKSESESFHLPALDVDPVDTTGAGDHFVAGFIAALLMQNSFEACCMEGRAYATESIRYLGGIMP